MRLCMYEHDNLYIFQVYIYIFIYVYLHFTAFSYKKMVLYILYDTFVDRSCIAYLNLYNGYKKKTVVLFNFF